MLQPHIIRRGLLLWRDRRFFTSGSWVDQYEQELERYFETTKFSLKHENDLERLKRNMALVYPRKRRLILIDLEAYERSQLTITEVGIAIYDPRSMEHAIVPHIQNIHLIVKQHKHKVNGKFVPDHKFGFNGGQSYLMNHKDIKLTLQKVMANAGANDDVFVSHGVGSDIKFLKLMGVLVPTDIATVDTHMLYSMSFDRYATLKQTCRSLNIPVSRMHNGGNDAYYTLLAAMKICDPNVRIKLGLDQHKVLEPRTKGEIQSLKFSDRAKVIPKEGDQVWDELKGLWNTD